MWRTSRYPSRCRAVIARRTSVRRTWKGRGQCVEGHRLALASRGQPASRRRCGARSLLVMAPHRSRPLNDRTSRWATFFAESPAGALETSLKATVVCGRCSPCAPTPHLLGPLSPRRRPRHAHAPRAPERAPKIPPARRRAALRGVAPRAARRRGLHRGDPLHGSPRRRGARPRDDGDRFAGLPLHYAEDGERPPGHGRRAAPRAPPAGSPTFLMTYGDSYLPFDYLRPAPAISAPTPRRSATMAVYRNEDRARRDRTPRDPGDLVARYEKRARGRAAATLRSTTSITAPPRSAARSSPALASATRRSVSRGGASRPRGRGPPPRRRGRGALLRDRLPSRASRDLEAVLATAAVTEERR